MYFSCRDVLEYRALGLDTMWDAISIQDARGLPFLSLDSFPVSRSLVGDSSNHPHSFPEVFFTSTVFICRVHRTCIGAPWYLDRSRIYDRIYILPLFFVPLRVSCRLVEFLPSISRTLITNSGYQPGESDASMPLQISNPIFANLAVISDSRRTKTCNYSGSKCSVLFSVCSLVSSGYYASTSASNLPGFPVQGNSSPAINTLIAMTAIKRGIQRKQRVNPRRADSKTRVAAAREISSRSRSTIEAHFDNCTGALNGSRQTQIQSRLRLSREREGGSVKKSGGVRRVPI